MIQKYRIIAVPAISFVVILFLFIFLIQFLFGKISPLNQQITDSKIQQAVLSQKLSTLQSLDQSTLGLTETAYIALPDTNPAALIVFQLRKVASENQITLNNLSVADAAIDGAITSQAIIEFEAEGSTENIMKMINSLKTTAPIVNIDKFKLNKVLGESVSAIISLYAYWAPLPATISNVDEEAVTLTDEELNVLSEISQYSLPEFNSGEPTTEEPRPNPFSIDN